MLSRMQQYKKVWQENGICVCCGRAPVTDGKTCNLCKERSSANRAKLRKDRIKAGLCVACGMTPPNASLKRCEPCLQLIRIYRKERKATNRPKSQSTEIEYKGVDNPKP